MGCWKQQSIGAGHISVCLLPEHTYRAKAPAALPYRPPSTAGQCSHPVLILPPVSLGHPSLARDQEQLFEGQTNINSCRFRKQEMEICAIELSLSRARHNYKVKVKNLSGSGAWKMC